MGPLTSSPVKFVSKFEFWLNMSEFADAEEKGEIVQSVITWPSEGIDVDKNGDVRSIDIWLFAETLDL